MWELPGGKMNANESQKKALTRIFKDYGIKFKSNSFIGKANHIYSHFSIEQHGYQCDYIKGSLISENHSEYKWISKGEEVLFPIHKASHKLLVKLRVNYTNINGLILLTIEHWLSKRLKNQRLNIVL